MVKKGENKLLQTTCHFTGKSSHLINTVRGTAIRRAHGLVNLVPALAYHFCLALPAEFTQPGAHLLFPSPVMYCSHLNELDGDGGLADAAAPDDHQLHRRRRRAPRTHLADLVVNL